MSYQLVHDIFQPSTVVKRGTFLSFPGNLLVNLLVKCFQGASFPPPGMFLSGENSKAGGLPEYSRFPNGMQNKLMVYGQQTASQGCCSYETWRYLWRTDLCNEMDLLLQTAILELKGLQRYTNTSYTPMHSNLSTHIFIASCDPLLVWNMLSTFQCATLMSQSYESTRVCVPHLTYKIGEFPSKTA